LAQEKSLPDGVARIAARAIESAVAKPSLPKWKLVKATKPHRRFASVQNAFA